MIIDTLRKALTNAILIQKKRSRLFFFPFNELLFFLIIFIRLISILNVNCVHAFVNAMYQSSNINIIFFLHICTCILHYTLNVEYLKVDWLFFHFKIYLWYWKIEKSLCKCNKYFREYFSYDHVFSGMQDRKEISQNVNNFNIYCRAKSLMMLCDTWFLRWLPRNIVEIWQRQILFIMKIIMYLFVCFVNDVLWQNQIKSKQIALQIKTLTEKSAEGKPETWNEELSIISVLIVQQIKQVILKMVNYEIDRFQFIIVYEWADMNLVIIQFEAERKWGENNVKFQPIKKCAIWNRIYGMMYGFSQY